VHLADRLLYDLLDVFDGTNHLQTKAAFNNVYPEGEINEALAELDELIGEGLLFSPLPKIEGAFAEEPLVKSLCLNVAHDCNLRCRYCFAGAGGFGGGRSLMGAGTGERAVEFAIAGSKGRKHIDIDFFGGEPLVNQQTVKHLIKYARQRERETGKEIKLTLTTNGLLLDELMQDFLDENAVALVLSLDGRPQVHDRMRPLPGGGGSYGQARAAFGRAIAKRGGTNYYLRGTYTKENLDFAEDARHLAAIGRRLSLEPVVEKDAAFRIDEADLPRIYAEYEKLADFYLESCAAGAAFDFFHFNLALDNGPCLRKRLAGCGAGHEYFAVTPEGDIYPCHQFVGRRNYLLGNLETGIARPDIGARFRRAHVLNKPDCADCWARFYCGGGCHANADLINGDIKKPYRIGCALQKKRIECAIAVQSLRADGRAANPPG
jgi:uncharacterized protein